MLWRHFKYHPAKDGHFLSLAHTKGSRTMKTKQSNKKRIKELRNTPSWDMAINRNSYRECYYRLIAETRRTIMSERQNVIFHPNSEVRAISLCSLLSAIRFQRLMFLRLKESRAMDRFDTNNVSPLP